ncbi:MAG: hypothetical protein P8Y67_01040 [Alphaproteobacteria bacterium]
MTGAEDFTLAQRLILENASEAELFQAIAHARVQHGTHLLLAGTVWDWADWGSWFEREVVTRAEGILQASHDEIHQLVCGEWEACAKIPGLASQFETASQIAEVVSVFVGGIVGKLLSRAVALAVGYILAEQSVEAFCECKTTPA